MSEEKLKEIQTLESQISKLNKAIEVNKKRIARLKKGK